MKSKRVWVVDDDQSIRWVLERALQRAEIDVQSFTSAEQALEALQQHVREPDVIISDVRMDGISGIELMQLLKENHDTVPPVIIMTAHADLKTAVSAYEGGAFEYIPKPFDVNEIVEITRRAFDDASSSPALVERPPKGQSDLIGESPPMQQLFRSIGRLARANTTVLINGESGTGKELIALALHQHSTRAAEPFIALNMAAITPELLESELFGHEKGAFTGASEQRKGRFEQADGGTLFLDEIGDMPADLQTRLLRVLSESQFFRVGGRNPIKIDVRIIAATHQDLQTLVASNLFREDLYHRLNVIRLHAPPLRERQNDVPLLLKAFLHNAANELGTVGKVSSDELNAYLCQLRWPGNVRQLENLARWLTVMATGRELTINDLPDDLKPATAPVVGNAGWVDALADWATASLQDNQINIARLATEQLERTLIMRALAHTQNRKQDAAALLGWGRNTLTRKLKEYDIE